MRLNRFVTCLLSNIIIFDEFLIDTWAHRNWELSSWYFWHPIRWQFLLLSSGAIDFLMRISANNIISKTKWVENELEPKHRIIVTHNLADSCSFCEMLYNTNISMSNVAENWDTFHFVFFLFLILSCFFYCPIYFDLMCVWVYVAHACVRWHRFVASLSTTLLSCFPLSAREIHENRSTKQNRFMKM